MRKRALIIHGWDGTPNSNWFQWLKGKLEEHDVKVLAPQMPDALTPDCSTWLRAIKNELGTPDTHTLLVGHSLGCITILRYLETLDKKIAGTILVAGFTDNLGYEFPSFFETPLNWKRINARCPQFCAIHSDNDPFVDIRYADIFKKHLNAHVVIEHGKGHLNEEWGNVNELPSALEKALLFLGLKP